jgi:hypothetical protein
MTVSDSFSPEFLEAHKGSNPSPSPKHASWRYFQQPWGLIAPNGQTHVEALILFLVALTRNIKSQEIFKLNSLNDIIIKAELYRAHTGLTQFYNCQQFRHAWANCKQTPRCLWRGGGHLHRECPEKTNTISRSCCCNCTLLEGEKPHPGSDRGCSHAKGELRRDPLEGRPTQLHCVKTRNISNHRHHRQMGEACCTLCSSICYNRTIREQVCEYRLSVHLTRAVLRSCTASRHAISATTSTTDGWEKLAAPCAAASATTGQSESRFVSTGSQFA